MGSNDQLNPWQAAALEKALTVIVGDDLNSEDHQGGSGTVKGKCTSCHAHSNLAPERIGQWIHRGAEVFSKCFQDFSIEPRERLSCFKDFGMDVGLMRALVKVYASPEIEYFPADVAKEFDEYAEPLLMPPGRELSPDDAGPLMEILYFYGYGEAGLERVIGHVRQMLVNTGGIGPTPEPLAGCVDQTTPELQQHIKRMAKVGWGARNLNDPSFKSFACEGRGECFTQKRDGKDVFPLLDIGDPEVRIGAKFRLLKEIPGQPTNYFSRVSADGEYLAVGGRGFEVFRNALDPSIPDNIDIDASFDPSFFPDNSGFVFHGAGMWMCNQKVLADPKVRQSRELRLYQRLQDPSTPEGKYCSVSNRVGVYQSVATSLGGDRHFVLNNDWEGDAGSAFMPLPVSAFSSPSASIMVHPVGTKDGKMTTGEPQSYTTPYEGDWFLAPSAEIIVGRKSTEGPHYVHAGYRVRSLDVDMGGDEANPVVERVESKLLANICLKGRKPTLSFDERILATNHYVDRHDWKEFGFEGPDDPAFVEFRNNQSNIWLYDLKTCRKVRITKMGPGRRALFPHFRSDGWIYFLVMDDNDYKTYYVATDAAMKFAKAADDAKTSHCSAVQ